MTLDKLLLNELFQYCVALCGQREDAYDLLQDAVEKYLGQNRTAIDNHKAFIKRIARNRFYDRQRRKNIVHFDALENPDLYQNTERDLESIVIDELTLRKVWNALSPEEREVTFLWAVEGFSTGEIAKQLSIPRGTILARLHRLRNRIETSTLPSAGGSYE